ncbi:peptidoglycan DD-metalloendopeptidase family protein [Inhella gelatinilytica]|uniref:Peptidoglycan DD-metalloendopeptidase family protein n=1 Tax=Inhella gelatinilytica TaxID=2795030 RepID=A0A931NBA1_9BURK|nr:peptidoglycan DD-metalloendopeptidase family protein [Inhella gelatinilytica]MBH9553353.1 peptidoglycan DD-metalloendopeptidase family protein [Inhella gelatinilytica]
MPVKLLSFSSVGTRVLCASWVVLAAACTAPQPHRAPVEDRVSLTPPAPVQPVPTEGRGGVEPARVGTYVVKPGDMLIRIALEHGVSYKDLARWNGLDNPNLIEVGQVLKVVPPGSVVAADGTSTRPIAAPRADSKPVELKPLDGKPLEPKNPEGKRGPSGSASVPAAPPSTTASVTAGPASGPTSQPTPSTSAVDGEPSWAWPAQGAVVAAFDKSRNKGVGLGGKAGDPVLAAADGRVMYAGSGLRGYGNMVIIKHNDTYLSAYAHNQAVLVKEDQVVRKGQRIAEMGSSDTDQVKLHFEIRRKGIPVDPAELLPPR